ncbi:hypothetical protein [Psychrobacillus vulpis]|uniref:Uncharacterized protein n=1 Tax=Psychrobacillus vulpis TaxID=2325572 RepID=A0A544TNV0_9BACI|nr:hypothetical protein [Psychrobacillus vulpis]TQR19102.1 hypothetical protein FG384_13920 [Psychrobacillus vulpis]
MYYERSVWLIHIPKINFILWGIAMFLLIGGFTVLWLMNIKKLSIILSILCTFACAVLLYGGSFSYVILSEEAIDLGKAFSKDKQSYNWENIERIHYYDD